VFLLPKQLKSLGGVVGDEDALRATILINSRLKKAWGVLLKSKTYEYIQGRVYKSIEPPPQRSQLLVFCDTLDVRAAVHGGDSDLPLFGGRRAFLSTDVGDWAAWVGKVRLAHVQRRARENNNVVLFPTHKALTVNESVDCWLVRRSSSKEHRMLGPSLIVAIKMGQTVERHELLNPRWVECFMGVPLGWVLLGGQTHQILKGG